MIKYRILLAFLGVLLLHLVSLASHAKPPRWLLRDSDTTIVLLSTVHVLSPGTRWMQGTLQADFAASDALILELAPEQKSPAVIQPLIGQYAALPKGVSLMGVLPQDVQGKFLEALLSLEMSPTQVARYRPWFASVMMAQTAFARAGFTPADGVETALVLRAKARDIPVRGLETMADQVEVFGTLAADQEIALLRSSLGQIGDAKSFLVNLSAAWLGGRLDRLEDLLITPMAATPDLYKRVFVDRNKRWSGKISLLMQQPGVYTVALGAGHFVGPDNLRDQLAALGYTLKKLN